MKTSILKVEPLQTYCDSLRIDLFCFTEKKISQTSSFWVVFHRNPAEVNKCGADRLHLKSCMT